MISVCRPCRLIVVVSLIAPHVPALSIPSRGSASGGIFSGSSGESSAGSDFHAALYTGSPCSRNIVSNSVQTSFGRGMASTRSKRASAAKHSQTTSKYSLWSVANSNLPPTSSLFQRALRNSGPNSLWEWCFFFGHGSGKNT